MMKSLYVAYTLVATTQAWIFPTSSLVKVAPLKSTSSDSLSLHGSNSCFLPIQQLDEEFFAPRIVQIAGMYPGLSKEALLATTSEPAAEIGQWAYDFSDPNGPQLGTVAVPGGEIVTYCEDPVVVICEHESIGVVIPNGEELTEPVDICVLVDRAEGFAERKFLVLEIPGQEEVKIGAYASKADMPPGYKVLGRVVLTLLPHLPCMETKKSGFMEEDRLW